MRLFTVLNITELKVGLILILLTLTSFYLGVSHSVLVSAVLLVTWLKGFLIIGKYMELQQAPRAWKYAINGYFILIISIIALFTL